MKMYMNNYFQNKLYFCLTQIMELQFKYPGLWLVNANLNNGISTQISLILRIKTQITELQFKYPVTETIIFKNKLYFCLTQIMELQFKYPGLWLVNANLNNGISTQISLILRIKTQITELQFKYPVTEWNGVEHVVMNIDESVFCVSTNYAASGEHIRAQFYSGSGNTSCE